jgi:hypothetical protein
VPHRLRRPDASEQIHDHAIPQKFPDETQNHEGNNVRQHDRDEIRIGIASLLGVPGIQKTFHGGSGGSSNDARHFSNWSIFFQNLFLGTFFEKVRLNVPSVLSIDMATNTEVEFMKQMSDRGLAPVTDQENTVVNTATAADAAAEMQTLKEIIVAWREVEVEVTGLSSQIREKKKKQKTMEDMILRIMKKNNIGALDLKGSGGRLLYRRHTTKGTLNVKSLTEMLTQHLKSETAATDALKFINEHRGAKVKESLMYERAAE